MLPEVSKNSIPFLIKISVVGLFCIDCSTVCTPGIGYLVGKRPGDPEAFE